jgi:hypothetical protein
MTLSVTFLLYIHGWTSRKGRVLVRQISPENINKSVLLINFKNGLRLPFVQYCLVLNSKEVRRTSKHFKCD